MTTESSELPAEPAQREVVTEKRVFQIRSNCYDWMEIDEVDYRRVAGMKAFDRRVLVVMKEEIKG